MAHMLIRTAMGMNKAGGGGARSVRSLSSAIKPGIEVEKIKQLSIGSVENKTVHQAVHGIKILREDKILEKATRTWLMAGLILGGFTFASTLVAEADTREMELMKEQVEQ